MSTNISHKLSHKPFLSLTTKSVMLLSLLIGANYNQVFGKPNVITPLTVQSNSSSFNLYKIKIERGQRRTNSGINRSYVLYLPQTNSALPAQPYPVVVMVHGFLMSSNQQSNNCAFLAQHGFVVLAPNMTKIMWGGQNRTENVKDVVDQTAWLVKESRNPTSRFYGLIDPQRMAIAGNSSGGAICFEVALEAQKANIPFRTLCSLEGVPWDRTLAKMSQIEPMHILSLRAEPCLCNYHSNVLKYLQALKFPADDVKINGAHHCDAENPTSIGCMSVCGTSHEKYRRLFQQVCYLYLRDTLSAPKLADHSKSFVEVMKEMQRDEIVIAHLDNLSPATGIANKEDISSPTKHD